MNRKRILSNMIWLLGYFLIATGITAQTIHIPPLQNKREQMKEPNPRTALAKADSRLQTALRQKNGPLIVKALLDRTTFQLEISQDSLPALIRQTEDIVKQTHTPAEKAVLNSVLAQFYQQYYFRDRYRLDNRTPIQGKVPENIQEWSGKEFIAQIYEHAVLALKPAEALQRTDVQEYAPVLIAGEDSRIFRPTLFDFLAHRTIQQLIQLPAFSIDRFFPQKRLTGINPTASIPDFLAWKGNLTDSYQIEPTILDIYQQLLRFHLNKQDTPAVIMANIDRLRYVASHLRNLSDENRVIDDNSFWQFYDSYKESPYATEILIAFEQIVAPFLTVNADPSIENNRLERLINAQNETIIRFPDYRRIDCLKQIRDQLTAPVCNNAQQQIFIPGKRTRMAIQYKNIRQLTIAVKKIKADKTTMYNASRSSFEARSLPGKVLFDIQRQMNDSLTWALRNDTIDIPPLTPGYYLIQLNADTISKPINETVVFVSNLYSTCSNNKTIIVTDGISGKPASKVRVDFYENESDSLKRVGTRYTDKNGLVETFDIQARYYHISDKNDIFSPITYLPYFYRPNAIAEDGRHLNIRLFTDRSIYRPGQIVYFSGIVYNDNSEQPHVLSEQKITVQLNDNQRNPVRELTLTSDSLGSFHGSFVLPTQLLTGDFQLTAGTGEQEYDIRYISVSEYKRPTFKIDFDPIKAEYTFKTPVTVSGRALSYSGYTLADTKIRYTVTRQPHFLRILPIRSEQIAAGEVTSDKKGNFKITFQPEKGKGNTAFDMTCQYRIDVEITSSSGETQHASTQVYVGDSPIIIRYNQPDKINKDISHSLPIQVVSLNGDTLRQPCTYILYSLYDNTDIDALKPLDKLNIHQQVLECKFQSGDTIQTSDWKKLPQGAYRMVVRTQDKTGRVISEESSFILYSEKEKRPPVLTALWQPELREYTVRPGEAVTVRFGSSYKNVYAYTFLYEGDRLIEKKTIRFSNRIISVPILYKAEYHAPLTLSIVFIKNYRLYAFDPIRIDKEGPNRQLSLQTSTFRDRLLPGQKEEWSFTIKDSQGKPATARMMATMFDASLNALRHHEWRFNPVRSFDRFFYLDWTSPQQYNYFFSRSQSPLYPQYECTPISFDRLDFGQDYSRKSWTIAGVASQKRAYADEAEITSVGAIRNLNEMVSEDAIATDEESIKGEGSFSSSTSDYRVNFNETAFFYPDLVSNGQGEVSFRFTVPESNTEWQFMALAYTKELLYGQLQKQIVSNKPLMVAPNLPRFVRQGDEVTVSVVTVNNSDQLMEGRLVFELFDPYTDSIRTSDSTVFILDAQQTSTHSFSFKVPVDMDLLGVRTRAITPRYSDGEQQLLPVLPSRALVTETLPFTIAETGKSQFTLKRLADQKQSSTLENYRLTLEYTANPIWFVVQALPSLSSNDDKDALKIISSFYGNTISSGIVAANPKIATAIRAWKSQTGNRETLLSDLQKNESLKTILLSESPWVLNATNTTERMQKLSELFDTERIGLMQRNALKQLRTLQGKDGGWSWFKGMKSSRVLTQNILEYMARLTDLNLIEYDQQAKEMQIEALRFIDNHLVENRPADSNVVLNRDNLGYLYVRTCFRDVPIAGVAMDYYRKLVDKTVKTWPNLSLSDKALAAIVLHRLGFKDEAGKILKSLEEYATRSKELGMFWQNNRSGQFREEGAIRVHSLITIAFNEIMPQSPLISEMKRWLLMQKQTQNWGTTPATSDAIYVLLSTGPDWLVTENNNSSIEWGGKKIGDINKDPLTGYIQCTKQGNDIHPEAATVTVKTSDNTPGWGALYWQYFEDFGRIEKTGHGLTIDKKLFVEEKTATGTELVPINQTQIEPGQKIVVRLVVKSDRDLEFVHLKDQRAACFEQTRQLSGYQWQDGLGYYREDRDAFTNFFFDFLPKGEYVFTYEVWLDRKGIYNNGATSVQCLYAPQYSAFSQGGIMIVR